MTASARNESTQPAANATAFDATVPASKNVSVTPPGVTISKSVDAIIARNDPNSIFNTLQAKVIALELNNSLILDWLTLWQTQISAKIRVLNTMLNETNVVQRGAGG